MRALSPPGRHVVLRSYTSVWSTTALCIVDRQKAEKRPVEATKRSVLRVARREVFVVLAT